MAMNDQIVARDRAIARHICRRSLDRGDALGWFETLYAQAAGEPDTIPWADLAPNPNLVSWLDAYMPVGGGATRACEVGCGLGDNAAELARRGFEVTAFDISPAAIAWARERFPALTHKHPCGPAPGPAETTPLSLVVADLFALPSDWRGAFDLVVESYTLQVLPSKLRPRAIEAIAALVAPGGTLLAIARGRERDDPEGEMPWPLMRADLLSFTAGTGLHEIAVEDYLDGETPPVRRFRAWYRRG
jgi:SAM-dependent methyltransferase